MQKNRKSTRCQCGQMVGGEAKSTVVRGASYQTRGGGSVAMVVMDPLPRDDVVEFASHLQIAAVRGVRNCWTLATNGKRSLDGGSLEARAGLQCSRWQLRAGQRLADALGQHSDLRNTRQRLA